jgi:hypothetical protein
MADDERRALVELIRAKGWRAASETIWPGTWRMRGWMQRCADTVEYSMFWSG